MDSQVLVLVPHSEILQSVSDNSDTSKENSIRIHMSHKKKPPTFHYTGWLIGILIMVYYNPYITG